jgi:hypothetical protein
MGFGLPSAIGAKVAAPEKIVVDIDGDASFSMTAMELATASQYNIGVKVLILNNEFQGMVLQWQGSSTFSALALHDIFDEAKADPSLPFFSLTFPPSLSPSHPSPCRPLLREALLAHAYGEPRLCQARRVDALQSPPLHVRRGPAGDDEGVYGVQRRADRDGVPGDEERARLPDGRRGQGAARAGRPPFAEGSGGDCPGLVAVPLPVHPLLASSPSHLSFPFSPL